MPPTFPYCEAQLLLLTDQIVRSHITVTGVQPKLLLTLAATGDAGQSTHFTHRGHVEAYILPHPRYYPSLSEGEDLTMSLATLAGLYTHPDWPRACDLVAAALANLADTKELALTLNGRKKKLKATNFQQAAQRAGVSEKVLMGLFTRFTRIKLA